MKSSLGKKISIILVILSALAIIAVFLLPKVLHPDNYRQLIVSQIQQATGGLVTLASLDWGMDDGLWLKAKDFSITESTFMPVDIHLSGLEIELDLLPLFSRQVVISSLNIQTPEISLKLAKSTADDEITDAKSDTNELTLPVEIIINKFNLMQGRLIIKDRVTLPEREIISMFTDVSIEASKITPGQDIRFQFSLNSKTSDGMGKITGQGIFSGLSQSLAVEDPQLELSASGNEIQTSLLKPYLADEALANKLDGSVSLDLDYKGALDANFILSGSIDLSDFSFTDASLWENALPGQAANIEYQLSASPDQLDISKLSVKQGEISLSANSRIHNWLQEPVIKETLLSGTFPLSSLDPLIPWVLLGEQGSKFRQTIRQQGEISLEQLTLPKFKLEAIAEGPQTLLSLIEGLANISGIAIAVPLKLPDIEVMSGTIKLHEGNAEASFLQGKMGPLSLPPVNIKATDLPGTTQISASAKGPMQLAASKHSGLSTLLREYNLKSLTGETEIDVQFSHDESKPDHWFASGDLTLNGVNMSSYHEGVQLADLHGRMKLKQDKRLDISIEKLRGKLENNPFHLNGSILSVGNPDMQIDAEVRTRQLDLSSLSTLLPQLQTYKLKGKLDSDANVHYLHAEPLKTRLNGHIELQGIEIQVPDHDLSIKDCKSRLELEGNSVTIKNTSFRINDQTINATGRLSNPRYPHGWLTLSSPRININKLLSSLETDEDKATGKAASTSDKSAAKQKGSETDTLPEWMQNLTLRLKTKITQGELNGQSFNNFQHSANYKKGLLENQELETEIGEGHVKSLGTTDLRNLEAIIFSIEPKIDHVNIQSLEKLLARQFNLEGPLTLSGKLKGTTGSSEKLLNSLKGHIEIQSGPGQIRQVTPIIKPLFAVLSVINLKGLLTGQFDKNFSKQGIQYTSLNITTDISDGEVNINNVNLVTPAIIVNGTGSLYMLKQFLDMQAAVKVLGTVDTLLGHVPLAGKPINKLTDINLNIKGPLENVTVMFRPDNSIENAIKEVSKELFKDVKDI